MDAQEKLQQQANHMKLLLLLFLTAVITAELNEKGYDEEKFRKLSFECGQELSIDPNDLDLIMKELIGGPEVYNCLLKCLLKKVGFIDNSGKVQLGDYEDVIPQHGLIKKVMEQCQHVIVETCDDALKLIKCSNDVIKAKLDLNISLNK